MTKPKEPPLSKLSKLKLHFEMNITWEQVRRLLKNRRMK